MVGRLVTGSLQLSTGGQVGRLPPGRDALEAFAAVRPPALPEGYLLRTFRDSDRDGWVRLMRLAGFDGWSHESLKGALSIALPEGIFFIEHGPAHDLAATAMAGHKPSELHPFGGELGWVAVSPPHRGRRLSSVVCVEATRRLIAAFDSLKQSFTAAA